MLFKRNNKVNSSFGNTEHTFPTGQDKKLMNLFFFLQFATILKWNHATSNINSAWFQRSFVNVYRTSYIVLNSNFHLLLYVLLWSHFHIRQRPFTTYFDSPDQLFNSEQRQRIFREMSCIQREKFFFPIMRSDFYVLVNTR